MFCLKPIKNAVRCLPREGRRRHDREDYALVLSLVKQNDFVFSHEKRVVPFRCKKELKGNSCALTSCSYLVTEEQDHMMGTVKEAEQGKGEEVPGWMSGGNTCVQVFVGCLAIKG